MNKKGIEIGVKELVGIVMAIFIAVVFISCTTNIGGKLTGLAKDDFTDVVNTLREMEDDQRGSHESHVFALDEGTVIVYFNEGQDAVVQNPLGDYIIKFEKPRTNNCDEDDNCLCLIREVEIESGDNGAIVTPIGDSSCESYQFPLVMENCDINPDKDPVYVCSVGFVLERLFPESLDDITDDLDEDEYITSRFTPLILTKEAAAITIARENEQAGS